MLIFLQVNENNRTKNNGSYQLLSAYSVQYSSLNHDALIGIRCTIDGLLEQMVDLINTKQMDTYLFGGNKNSKI